MSDHKIAIINTGVKDNLAENKFNNRKEDCERGVKILQTFNSDIKSLRDVKLDFLK